MARRAQSSSGSEDEEVFEVEKIVNHKPETDSRGRTHWKFLIRWKGYGASDDTWEPRDSLMQGAENVLDAYIKAKAKEGIHIGKDGEKKQRVPSSRRESQDAASAAPVSTSSKRRKSGTVDEDQEIEAPLPKKKKSSMASAAPPPPPAAASLSPSPPPAPRRESHANKPSRPSSSSTRVTATNNVLSKKSSSKGTTVNIDDSDDDDDEHVVAEEVTRTPVEPARKPKKSLPKERPEIHVATRPERVLGSLMYIGEETWEHLLTIDTLEQDENTYRWGVNWILLGESEYIPNEIARRKFPQRMLDFYQEHLKFKNTGPEDEEMEEE